MRSGYTTGDGPRPRCLFERGSGRAPRQLCDRAYPLFHLWRQKDSCRLPALFSQVRACWLHLIDACLSDACFSDACLSDARYISVFVRPALVAPVYLGLNKQYFSLYV